MSQPLIFTIWGGTDNQNNYVTAILEMEFDFDVFVIPESENKLENKIENKVENKIEKNPESKQSPKNPEKKLDKNPEKEQSKNPEKKQAQSTKQLEKQIEAFIKDSKSKRVAILGYYEKYNLIWTGFTIPIREAFYIVGRGDISLRKFRHFISSLI
jgi:hypothetical protein